MKKLLTFIFLLASLTGMAQTAADRARITALETLTKAQASEILSLKNFRVVVVGGTSSGQGDTLFIPAAKTDSAIKIRQDSAAVAIKFLQTAMVTYQRLTNERFTTVNKRVDDLPAAIPPAIFDTTAIYQKFTDLNTALTNLINGKASAADVEIIKVWMNKVKEANQ